MARTDSFRTQHKDLAEVVTSIEGKLASISEEGVADEVRTLLSSLSGKLMVHLAMEDKSLYPTMLSSDNDEAKKVANAFMTEMGSLADAFKEYVGAWPSAIKIKENPDEFCNQTKAVFQALKDRIQREESTLYQLADSL